MKDSHLIKVIKREFNYFYVRIFSYFIARYCSWVLFPFYYYFKNKNYLFVVNLASGLGHATPELDYVCRLRHLSPTKKFILFKAPDPFVHFIKKTYPHHFDKIASPFFYHLFLPITMRFKDLILDIGTSALKWQLPPPGYPKASASMRQSYIYFVSKNEDMKAIARYYLERKKQPNHFPLKEIKGDKEALLRYLNPQGRKIVLIHFKHDVRNCIAKAFDPHTYLKTLQFLKSETFLPIFVGRETMPDLFADLGVMNYANSTMATLQNDFLLFTIADFAITAAGIGFIPDCLDVPYLYLNSWHLVRLQFSPKCITVPALLDNEKGRPLSFLEQHRLYLELENHQGVEAQPSSFFVRNASSDEILAATKEALEGLEINDRRFHELFPKDSMAGQSLSKISSYFLAKHESRLACESSGESPHTTLQLSKMQDPK